MITDINGVSEQLSALFTTLTRDKSAHWRRDSLFMKEKKVSDEDFKSKPVLFFYMEYNTSVSGIAKT